MAAAAAGATKINSSGGGDVGKRTTAFKRGAQEPVDMVDMLVCLLDIMALFNFCIHITSLRCSIPAQVSIHLRRLIPMLCVSLLHLMHCCSGYASGFGFLFLICCWIIFLPLHVNVWLA